MNDTQKEIEATKAISLINRSGTKYLIRVLKWRNQGYEYGLSELYPDPGTDNILIESVIADGLGYFDTAKEAIERGKKHVMELISRQDRENVSVMEDEDE